MVLDHYSKESTTDGSKPPSVQMKQRVPAQGKENGDKIITKGLNVKKKAPQQNSASIETNFQKALINQNDEFTEVTNFLNGIKMEKYKDLFIDHGIEDTETILELNESHLEEMGLPLGHKLKIMKRIKETKKKEVPVQQNTAPISTQANEQKSASASASTTQNSNNLLDGVYDEEQNKREFQEALMAWRNTGNKNNPAEEAKQHVSTENTTQLGQKSKNKKSVRFAEDPAEELLILNEQPEGQKEDDEATEIQPKKKPTTSIKEGMLAFKGTTFSNKSFLLSEEVTGSSCWNVDLLSTVDHAGTSPRESAPLPPPPPKVEKELCHQCYKFKEKALCQKDELTKKTFCSIDCMANFFSANVAR